MGGDIDSKDEEGNTVLMIGIQHNHIDLVRELVKLQPSLMEVARNGKVYPIHLAATGGKAEILQILVDNKCNL